MIRILLSTVMVAAQLVSWNAWPRYLCRSDDGSICVDLGPVTCVCCRHDEPDAAPSDDHAACAHHDDGQAPGEASFAPCGCTHVQLSEAQTATLIRPLTAPDAHRLALPAAFAAQGGHSCLAAAIGPAPHARPPDTPGQALATLACVVLRC
jgi:hypothetical protein